MLTSDINYTHIIFKKNRRKNHEIFARKAKSLKPKCMRKVKGKAPFPPLKASLSQTALHIFHSPAPSNLSSETIPLTLIRAWFQADTRPTRRRRRRRPKRIPTREASIHHDPVESDAAAAAPKEGRGRSSEAQVNPILSKARPGSGYKCGGAHPAGISQRPHSFYCCSETCPGLDSRADRAGRQW